MNFFYRIRWRFLIIGIVLCTIGTLMKSHHTANAAGVQWAGIANFVAFIVIQIYGEHIIGKKSSLKSD